MELVASNFHRSFARKLPWWFRRFVDPYHYNIYRFVRHISLQVELGASVIDLGAGEAEYRALFEHAKYVTCDNMVGNSEWDYSNIDIVIDLMNPDAVDTLRETFDYAICNLVIEHVPDPQLLLDQIAKFLKPGGRGYLLAPLMWGQHHIPHDYFRFTSFGLDLLLRRAGFSEIHIAPIGGFFYFFALQLQLSVLLLFPDRMAWWLKLILVPVKLLAYCVLGVALPFLVRQLDMLDTAKNTTVLYECSFQKPMPL